MASRPVQVLVGAATISGFFYGAAAKQPDIINISAVTFIFATVISQTKRYKENLSFIMFSVSFLLFHYGRWIVSYINPIFEAKFPRPDFSLSVELEASIIFFIGYFSFAVTYLLYGNRRESTELIPRIINSTYYKQLRRISGFGAWLLVPVFLLIGAERAVFVLMNGYDAYYVSFRASLPVLFYRLGSLYEPLLFLYLGTLPRRKQALTHIIVYVVVSCISLGFGQRNGIILALIFSVLYFSSRDLLTPSARPWLSKKMVWAGTLLLIPTLSFLSYFSYWRSDYVLQGASMLELLQNFFVSQGTVAYNLAYSIEYIDRFPDAKTYTIGPIIAFFKESFVAQIFFGTQVYPGGSPEQALLGDNFSFALAYIVNPAYFARGGGFGSSYLAELWVDFGLVGVILGSIAYGSLMAWFLGALSRGGPFIAAIAFQALVAMIYAPRAQFMGFVIPLLSMPTLALYAALYLAARKSERVSQFDQDHPNISRSAL